MHDKRIMFLFTRICFAALFAFSNQLYAQLNTNNLTHYTEQDGLPGAEVHTIINDRSGYMWIGTINGLTRFDGYEFKRFYYNPNDNGSINGLNVWSTFEDRKGNVWIGVSPSSINQYNAAEKKFRQYPFSHLIDHPQNLEVGANAMCQDNNGRIYFGIQSQHAEAINNALLYKDENSNEIKQFKTPTGMSIGNVDRITRDASGNIWVLSFSGIFKIDVLGKLTRLESPALKAFIKNDERPTDVKIDNAENIWLISSSSRLYRINQKQDTCEVYTPTLSRIEVSGFNSIIVDAANNIWLATNNGVFRFRSGTKTFEKFDNSGEIDWDKTAVNSLWFDAFGSLWIGTNNRGLFRYEERALFKSYSYSKDDEHAILPGWANALFETANGNILISTIGITYQSGGINELETKAGKITSTSVNSILNSAFMINSFFELKPGELSINTFRGNYQFSPATKDLRRIQIPGVADSITINLSHRDKKGSNWLCTTRGLFRRDKEGQPFRRYDLSQVAGSNASSNEITRLVESDKHGLWLATNNGLFLYNYASDKIERHGNDRSTGNIFSTQDINSIYEDSAGILWVGNWQGGLNRYDAGSKKITTYTINDGLPSMCVQGILPDEKNNALWLSTFEGLSRFDLKTKQFNNFSIADGIQGQLFADGSYLKTTDGLFVFGGSNGITVFKPGDIVKKSIPPHVFLTDLKLFNQSVVPGEKSILKKPVWESKGLALNYDQNNISIEFVAIHYSNPAKNKYLYKLENYDNEWRDVGAQHTAFYPSLPPGKYVFRVKAANNNGVWNQQGATLMITVNPPWWKTTWAYILYGLIFLLLAFLFDRYFRYRVIRKEKEKNQARELTQAKEIEKAYKQLKLTQAQLIQSEKMASLGELTAGIAHEIQNPLNFVNNFSDLNKELVDELEHEINEGRYEEAKAIANDLKANEEKINHHGKRAQSIVSSMLQHSRSGKGEKRATDINKLLEEYLALAYHARMKDAVGQGMHSKDESLPAAQAGFNCSIEKSLDESIEPINIIPQEIGWVILNLLNNAFYAVAEKAASGIDGFQPTVSLTSKKDGEKVIITLSDNGNGIPANIKEKIFQPFFTTKPTGQGTGLGLSLSYDIVKAHGGQLWVESEEGVGTVFTIQLPVA